jgi:hypothetical protein
VHVRLYQLHFAIGALPMQKLQAARAFCEPVYFKEAGVIVKSLLLTVPAGGWVMRSKHMVSNTSTGWSTTLQEVCRHD